MKNPFWPVIDDLWSAKKACIQASSVAFLIGGLTAIVTFMQVNGTTLLPGLNGSSFIDAGIFLVLAVFVYRCSRIAAITAFLLYLFNQALQFQESHRAPMMAIFFSLLLISGIRGAFEYHEMKKGMSEEEIKTTLAEQREASDPAPSLTKRIIGWTLLTILAGGGLYLLYNFTRKPSSNSKTQITIQDSGPGKTTAKTPAAKAAPAAPLPGEQVFKFKNGQTITGRIVGDDPVYYTVETSGGRQEIVIKEDLAQ